MNPTIPTTEPFDEIKACTDVTYLTKRTDEARTFAETNLSVENINFLQALRIKALLGERVDPEILRGALAENRLRDGAIFYLSNVPTPEMDQGLIELLNERLAEEKLDSEIFPLIRALIGTGTTKAKFYLKGLIAREELKNEPIIRLAIEEAKDFLQQSA